MLCIFFFIIFFITIIRSKLFNANEQLPIGLLYNNEIHLFVNDYYYKYSLSLDNMRINTFNSYDITASISIGGNTIILAYGNTVYEGNTQYTFIPTSSEVKSYSPFYSYRLEAFGYMVLENKAAVFYRGTHFK